MTTHEDLAVPYHQQDTNYYCGAACAQMVLSTLGQGLLGQDGLYADNHSHNAAEPNWYTAPDGLLWTMQHRQSSKVFVLDALDSEDALSRMLAWTIHHYQVAPVALVFGWQHWIVVRGYTASAAPTRSDDTTYGITGFDVNNPWPPVPAGAPGNAPLPPPHGATDGCGGGGTRGIDDEHIAYATWKSTYMTGVPSGHWANKFVAVCDPDPPARSPGRIAVPVLPRQQHLLDAVGAARAALDGLRAEGIAQRPAWSRILAADAPGEAVLVQRLDRTDSYYYVVPVGRDTSTMTSAVIVDALTGQYRQSAVFGSAPPRLATVDPVRSARDLVGARVDLGARRGFLTLRPQAISVHTSWVWKPCLQSLSPYYPFKLVTLGALRLYVRSDGAIFSQLTTTGRGA